MSDHRDTVTAMAAWAMESALVLDGRLLLIAISSGATPNAYASAIYGRLWPSDGRLRSFMVVPDGDRHFSPSAITIDAIGSLQTHAQQSVQKDYCDPTLGRRRRN